jgi:hypothetical protein
MAIGVNDRAQSSSSMSGWFEQYQRRRLLYLPAQ